MDASRSIPPSGPSAPFGRRVVGAIGAASLAALLGAIPATLRTGSAMDGAAMYALTLAPAGILVALIVLARRGARAFAERSILPFVGVTGLFLFDAAASVGSVLRKTTHHHVLAGVTLGLFLLALVALALPVAKRLASSLSPASGVRSVPSIVAVVVLTLIASGHLATLFRGPTAGFAFDGVALVLAATFASTQRSERWVLAFLPLVLVLGTFGALRLHERRTHGTTRNLFVPRGGPVAMELTSGENAKGALTTGAGDLGSDD